MPTAAAATPMCHVEGVSGHEISGWAIDPARPAQPVRLHVIIDQQEVGQVVANLPHDDLPNDFNIAQRDIGFNFSVPDQYRDGRTHRVEFRDARRNIVRLSMVDEAIEYVDYRMVWPLRSHSHVDGVRNGALEGWVLRNQPDTANLSGNAMIRITCDNVPIGHTRAGMHRGDVAKAFAAPPNCGFRFVPPRAYLKPYMQTFRLYLMPENQELDESPLQTSFVSDRQEAQIIELTEAVDKLYQQITAVRRQLSSISTAVRYTIYNYNDWYPRYAATLRSRVLASRNEAEPTPLVSIICPVYRPRLPDFMAAVQSVINQTYFNWELVIVDDGSKDPELTATIQEFAAADGRIVVKSRRKNAGISMATNAALKVARGEWIAFFDHDDLLADVAIEVMVSEAQRSGAHLLYSDEDKIGENGMFSDPALKPDWNHRLLLGVNYVCHLLFVRKQELDKVGYLDSRFDGAQDHDLILRLGEAIPRASIHHVAEVLYHWRITPQSTASSVANKSYAVQAGIDSVAAHLQRLGRPSDVTSINDITLYKANWKTTRTPLVTVIIPFKDEIETTRQCLTDLLKRTKYDNYDIILVDNWSTSAEYLQFADEIKSMEKVRLLRIEQPFNYSRINNLAAASSNSEFFVFMNNDLFVTDSLWLRMAIDEMIVDPEVAIVGGRFYYPNGTVQHAGVVLGVGGVAGHVHVGVPRGEYGYAGRMLFAQEISAVTAAGMVMQASVFREVGGFDEVCLQVAFNDIDLCLKVTSAGYRIIWIPDFVADHHESLSRGSDERPVQEARFFAETQLMKERWGEKLLADPYYNKHFTLDGQPYFDLSDPDTPMT